MNEQSLFHAQARKLLDLITGQTSPAFVQVAALCLRDGPAGREVLLVQTLERRVWIIPKGWPMKGKTLAEAARIEAWEEAGVRGTVAPQSIGAFTYTKIKKSGLPVQCRAQVFQVDVASQADQYPEAKRRTRRWVTPAQAAEMVHNDELRALLSEI